MMKSGFDSPPKSRIADIRTALTAGTIGLLMVLAGPGAAAPASQAAPRYYLPGTQASKIVTVGEAGPAATEVTVLTEAVAVKETGPAATVAHFGEVYAFSPALIVVHRGEPTMITFWNLQPDDNHDFALLGPDLNVLMYEDLPPLKKTSWVFTFHKEGVFNFKCLQHQPEMGGQILVLPPGGHHGR
jgi:plastocyanin